MCGGAENHGFYHNERDILKIKAFYLRLSVSKVKKNFRLPESLTLIYLPRINESLLEINDTKVRPDSSGFLTLYRMRSEEEKKRMVKDEDHIEEVVYGSREKVKVSEGVRFEVYSREEKIFKGIYRKDLAYDDWKLESKCVLENDPFGFKISEAEIFVSGGDGDVRISEKIDIVMKRRNLKKRCFKQVLDDIPEDTQEGEDEMENEYESDSNSSCCCCCSCNDEMIGSDFVDGEECLEKSDTDEEGTWAVDVGIWVMCLGVGYLVSKAASTTLRRKMMIFR